MNIRNAKKNLFLKLIFFPLFILFISGCASAPEKSTTSIQPQQAPRKFITILGSDVGWYEDKVDIFRDFSVSGLRVRISSPKDTKSLCVSGAWRRIEIDGPINKDTSYVIDKAFSEIQHCIIKGGVKMAPEILMNSNGGTLEDGYLIGRILRKHGVAAVLTPNQVCASACAVAYLGGSYRSMHKNAQLIFHAPYVKKFEYGYESIRCADTTTAKPLLNYYQEMLGTSVAQKLFERTMDYCSQTNGWTLDSGAAEFFGILKKSNREI